MGNVHSRHLERRLPVSGLERGQACHPERSEGSLRPASQILRCAQDDRPYFPMSISTALPSSSPPSKKNDQKNHQGASMTTRQTIASPTPPNVKTNSSTTQKNLSQNRTHFPKNPSHPVQNRL